MKKVIVIGGGVAGMSAAHELAERGFEVEVFERHHIYCGGKARSVDVPGTNILNKDKFLPGEHGFRFFPGFYRHVTDTMKRIPYTDVAGKKNSNGCYDNLTATYRIMIARNGKPPIITIANFPKSLKDLKVIIHDMTGGVDSGLTSEEIHFFASRVWQLMTSSTARRENQYERIGWWEFMEADRFSTTYQHLLVEGLTRTLVAAQAKTASTKTGGDIFLQLIFNMINPDINTDRVLNGPTNEKWLYPWRDYLQKIGVKYNFHSEVTGVSMKHGIIENINHKTPRGVENIATADYFVMAVPVEKAALLVSAEMIQADGNLADIPVLAKSVSWMNGIQYFLNEDIAINKGHIILSDSEWAITCISQVQFWTDYNLTERYNGKVKGVLSVDISDWLYTKYKGKIAEDYDHEEVASLVWEQLKAGLNEGANITLRDSMIELYYLDRDIKWNNPVTLETDKEPLLVNTINSWDLRPEATTAIPNFFLAADYVRTNTDLATMEGANEAARRAVNGILLACGIKSNLCKVWSLQEPLFFLPLKWYDEKQYYKGLPYTEKPPFWLDALMVPWSLFTLILAFFRVLFARIFN